MTEERDPKISRRYRSLGSEEPSRELDQAILAAAHRAADRPHAPLVTPAGRHRWYFAFGAAAILVLAIAVTVQVERQQPDAEAPPASPAPVRQDAAEGLLYRKEAEKDSKPAEAQAPVPQQENREEPAAVMSRAERPAAEQRAARAPSAIAPAAQAPRERAADDRAALGSAAAVLSPERLLERIAELRKDARHEEADKLLAEFRQRYPDYRIPEETLQKVERKK